MEKIFKFKNILGKKETEEEKRLGWEDKNLATRIIIEIVKTVNIL